MKTSKSLLLAALLAATAALAQSKTAAPTGKPSPRLLTPQNSAVIFIDHQPQMAFAVASIDRSVLVNNTVGLAKAAKAFSVPVILTSVAEKTFSGPIFPELQAVFPDVKPIDRTTMDSWEDRNFIEAVKRTGRKKLVIAGLWTEVCIATATLSAIDEGYEVYVVTDASGGVTKEAHDMAVLRMVQAGAHPMTWLQVLLEYQRDWARKDTYDATVAVSRQHGGAYGVGLNYARAMLGEHAREGGH